MRFIKSRFTWIITSIVLTLGYVVSCTKANQVLDLPQTGTQTNTSTDLVSVKTTTAPVIDGTIDAIWNNATKLNVTPTVPDPGNGLFTGYIGQGYNVTLRSMYDNDNIYFLAEIADNTKSANVSPWYFDPVSQRWNKEPSSRSFDVNGNLLRNGWGEDKLAFLWNVDYSTPKFLTQTCYASCHVFTPYMDYTVPAAPVYKSNAASGNHYTNGPDEKIDMWWGRLGFMSFHSSLNQMDDNYQDWAGGPAVTNLAGGNANGRHVDDIVVNGTSTTWPNRPTYTTSPTQGEINNTQSLKLDGTGASVSVPLWVKLNATNNNFILATDTVTGGSAVKITGVSSTGVLTYAGGSIDPNVGTDYQRTGDPVTGGLGAKAIAGFIAAPLIGGRADITGNAFYTGSGWVVELKRKLKTADLLKQDVDFSKLTDQQFGVAVWDASNYQHGIKPNLVLKFQK
jgi:hypothetical protein